LFGVSVFVVWRVSLFYNAVFIFRNGVAFYELAAMGSVTTLPSDEVRVRVRVRRSDLGF
jgi:hypothetical protein